VEGDSDDPAIEALRNRQVKNFLTLELLSIGAPMLLMGDEIRRTQRGNNNAYCHDSEISWMDWSLLEKHGDVFRFVKELIRSRLSRESSSPDLAISLNRLLASSVITWHGVKLQQPDWSDNSHSIAFTFKSISGKRESHFIINAFHEALPFELPGDGDSPWRRWIDTSLRSPHDICYPAEPLQGGESQYTASSRSIVVLVRYPEKKR
jgi:glycogen operon protein